MELYTLDSLFRRQEVVDRFESLIWTERFNAFGDFELQIESTRATRGLLQPGVWLSLNNSYRLMKIETWENGVSTSGERVLILKGRSMEMVLEDRLTITDPTSTPDETKVVVVDPPVNIIKALYGYVFHAAGHNPLDVLPVSLSPALFPTDTIPGYLDPVVMEFDFGSLYASIKRVADIFNIGFRYVRDPLTNQLYFHVYTGSDRTTGQTTLPAVVFSPDMDNLQNTTEFTSIAGAKNVAIVTSSLGRLEVFAENVPSDISGFERKVLWVNASDLKQPTEEGSTPLTSEEITAALTQRGEEELSKHRSFSAFDGEIDQSSDYKYGVDYQLGDLVEMRNTDGVTNQMRVTEQIFVSDREGERSYPTLAINLFIESGSWLSWEQNRVWADMGLTEYWEDLP